MNEAIREAREAIACAEIDTLTSTKRSAVSNRLSEAGLSQDVAKKSVAKHFSAASGQYDRYAQVQKQIAQVNLELLNKVIAKRRIACAVDLGCGTGIHTKSLAAMSERCLAVDISLGMLEMAKSNHAETKTAENKKIQYCTGDAEQLPLQSGTVNIVHSSMALQWCSSPSTAVSEIARVLSSNGSAQLAIMLDSSLHELRQAWESLGLVSRVNQFFSQQQWLEASEQLRSEQATENHTVQFNIDYKVEVFTEWHQSSLHMLRALKRIGAATKNTATHVSSDPKVSAMASSTRIGKQELHALDQQMRKQRKAENPQQYSESASSTHDVALPLSYQVLFLSIHKSKE
jgi:malonyl-CoA O-methyltransferase